MELNGELKLNKDGIMDIRRHQRDVAAMDANYTKEELAGAQRGIAHFELDVATGSKVLLLNAIVANGASDATRMDDGAPDLLTPLNGVMSPLKKESKPAGA
ncbi:lysis protein [Cronobacter dublinensis]